ncbi:hypothetical protein [Methylocaldum sp.]|uniref:hypothetical protein n=1 Tax=Methylocaldum sp. TaxID=1969727 RepID=UPI002D33C274|nr:hypothetical protein [Methylocaldum sp.]HYE38259.1 hypothetical protein [Methylocaldum sp.]
MTTFVNKPGLGTIFPNRDKKGDNHPDIKGSITLNDGQVVNFAGWRKADKNGGTYYSLKQDKPRGGDAMDDFRQGGSAGVADSRGSLDDIGDDIPFISNRSVW